jgi:helix-turn-helix protein
MISCVLKDTSIIKPAERHLMLVLANCHNPKRGCFPSIPTLARLTGYTERYIYMALEHLTKTGHLSKIPGGGRGKPNQYIFAYQAQNVIQAFPSASPPRVVRNQPSKRVSPRPTREQFVAYGQAHGISDRDCNDLLDIWEASNWCDGNGTAIKNWKGKLLTQKKINNLPSDKRARMQPRQHHATPRLI